MSSVTFASGEVEQAAVHADCDRDEERFRLFYERTARPLRAYLLRALCDISKADDLLQESYLRLLRAKLPVNMENEHRKNYLFRIAANLLKNEHGRAVMQPLSDDHASVSEMDQITSGRDVSLLLAELKPRERELLWLAYIEKFSHAEIASMVGSKPQSIRPMLARARTKLAGMLRAAGFDRSNMREVEK
jgi:RNA polymerase sigma-70 factor, ECF subfamily